jgi:hypothetical protein
MIFISALFVYSIWSILLIFHSSTVGFNGDRYFSLFDDAMVSMRYAWNLSHGQGLVWNPGERVEGYTNLLMTLIMSVSTAFLEKSSAVFAIQVLGLLFNLGSAILVWQVSDSHFAGFPEGMRFQLKLLVLLMTLMYYPLAYWSLMGMETGVLTLLLLAALYTLERYRAERAGSHPYIIAGWMGLAFLARPDALIFCIPIYSILIETAREISTNDRTSGKKIIGSLLLLALFPIAQMLFRISYYGDLLPNTYYLKLTGMPMPDRLLNGLGFIAPYLATHGFLLVVVTAGCRLWRDARRWWLLMLAGMTILYQVWIGGDAWAYWRIVTPVYPMLAILFAGSMHEILSRSGFHVADIPRPRLLSYLVILAILISNLTFLGEMLFLRRPYQTEVYASLINTAIALDEVTTEEASIGVYWAGIIPYYTGRPSVDFLGKSDKYIARLQADLSGVVSWDGMYSVPGHNKYDLDYSIKNLLPTYIQYPAWKGEDLSAWAVDHYQALYYKGILLWLKRGAPEVRWDLLPD